MLKLYPQDFRSNFGAEMQAVFTERLANRLGFGSSIQVFLHEMCDWPGALLQQYRYRHIWVLSATGSLTRESDRLEARLRRESYRRQFFSLLKAALFITLFITAVFVHGYLFTVYIIHQSVQEFGIYSTLDEAIQSSDEQYERYYQNVKSVSIIIKRPIKAEYDFIWEVDANVNAERRVDDSPIDPRHKTGTIYYVHTKGGWVPYVKETWIEVGFLPYWMKFFHLYGEGI
jgi:hypothetical protein